MICTTIHSIIAPAAGRIKGPAGALFTILLPFGLFFVPAALRRLPQHRAGTNQNGTLTLWRYRPDCRQRRRRELFPGHAIFRHHLGSPVTRDLSRRATPNDPRDTDDRQHPRWRTTGCNYQLPREQITRLRRSIHDDLHDQRASG